MQLIADVKKKLTQKYPFLKPNYESKNDFKNFVLLNI